MRKKLPILPQLLSRKIYKTGQTRGADDDVIYQNRVGRNSTVLIPFPQWKEGLKPPKNEDKFENGYIVLVSPDDYFGSKNIENEFKRHQLTLGINTLIFYETREQWLKHKPLKLKWSPAKNRTSPLGGQFVARVPATTAIHDGGKIVQGFTTSSSKGAGIRAYEYASTETTELCRYQLEALFWLCDDAEDVVMGNGMTKEDAQRRKSIILETCKKKNLLNIDKLISARVINPKNKTICPLCLAELSGHGFLNRMAQAPGRLVHDLTITEINLFHIEELKYGKYNHCPYNLGWGHHHCNVVTKDMGVDSTIQWMRHILQKNIEAGHLKS